MRTYRLVEIGPDGLAVAEEFASPSDQDAEARVLSVVEGCRFELWCGDRRVAAGGEPAINLERSFAERG